MPRSSPQERIQTLIARKRRVESDLAGAVGRLAAVGPPPVPSQKIEVPAGASVTAVVDSRNVSISLALNRRVLPHPGMPRFEVSVSPLQPGENSLLIAPFAIDEPWAFEVLLLVDGVKKARVADQGTDVGPRPPVVLHLVVS